MSETGSQKRTVFGDKFFKHDAGSQNGLSFLADCRAEDPSP